MKYFTLNTTSYLDGIEVDIEATINYKRVGLVKELQYIIILRSINGWKPDRFSNWARNELRQNAQNVREAVEEREKMEEE